MKVLYVAIPIVLLLILGVVFFTVSSGSDDDAEDITEETAATEETDEPAETDEEVTGETDEEPREEVSSEDNGQDEPSDETAEESEQEENSDAENGQDDSAEETTEKQSEEQTDASNGSNEDYNTAEQCIMSELTECEGISQADQFLAYESFVADGILPQAPGSDCLPCAVKYSFEAEYGESREIDTSVLPRSLENPGEIENKLQFVRQYTFALPGYFNDIKDEALDFYHPDSEGYNLLVANKASGNYRNHMTYAAHIDSDEVNQDGSTDIYLYRVYSHENTDGIFEAYARYNVIEADGRYYLTNYEELENSRIE